MVRYKALYGASRFTRDIAVATLIAVIATPIALAQPVDPVENAGTADALDLRMEAYALFPGSTADKARAIALFRQAADMGDGEAMAFLGSLYLSGEGVPADRAEAIGWYAKAAQTGHVGAMAKLAELASASPAPAPAPAPAADPAVAGDADSVAGRGSGPAENLFTRASALQDAGDDASLIEARALYQEAADLGHVEAMGRLARMFETGTGGIQSAERTLYWYKKAAENGWDLAAYSLGRAYSEDRGVIQNRAAAFEWYHIAAAAGQPAAMRDLAKLYDTGGFFPQSFWMARLWRERAARVESGETLEPRPVTVLTNPSPHSAAQGLLVEALNLHDGSPTDRMFAREFYTRAAEMGHPTAMVNLGAVLALGRGGPKDMEQAIYWTTLAAEAGVHQAMAQLGEIYADQDMAYDIDLAREWFEKAEAAGNEGAAQRLAELAPTAVLGTKTAQADGLLEQDTPETTEQAIALYLAALEEGDAEAGYKLGMIYREGTNSITASPIQANVYFQMAANMGHEPALSELAMALAPSTSPGDQRRFVQLALRPAEAGDTRMYEWLALAYFEGKGVDRDAEEGLRWAMKAADAGYALGYFLLGAAYLSDPDIEPDMAKGVDGLYQAYLRGFEQARDVFELATRPEFVLEMQSRLAADGFYRGPLDGDRGPGTNAALASAFNSFVED